MIIRVLDCETTGLDPAVDRVVEIASVELARNGDGAAWEIQRPCASFVDPKRAIPPEASAIHHIIDADLVGAPDLDEALAIVLYPLAEVTIVSAHNARFDHGFLPQLKDRKWIDTYRCALHIWPDAPNHQNNTLRYWLGIDLPRDGAHRALADVTVTAHILKRLLAERSVEELIALSTKCVVLKKVGFGKHFGSLWTDVPHDYLSWADRQDFDPDVKFTIKSEIARRRGRAA